ncbi:hypothetical protein FHX81_5026 [Saccharothrix saharensis]|uniref:Protein RecA n=1 Tax=Saccharothrix saharensis TaxID=571190 RepID=A0A543JIQ8_9PSEU|nr:hypothetical protein [Saccharothrix saharensis]TQM82618.1 hypothetical protein FHX81_5026 [Saccharothrix saharensis]
MSRSATATLTALGVGAAGELTTAPARTLPVRGELAGLLPWGGLRRGSTVSVRGSTSLLLALMAAATGEGCWAAVVGLPGCGALAAAELGVAVHRLALVPRPGRDQGEVEKTVAALLDGFDLVALATPVTPATSRKLSARARHRKAVLLPFTVPWPGSDVELTATSGRWTGLSAGHGLLTSHTVTVQATGRGAAARPRRTTVVLPGNTDVPSRRPTLAPVPSTDPPRSPAAPSTHPPSAGSPSTDVPAAGLSTAGALSAGLPARRPVSADLSAVDRSAVGPPSGVPAGPPADSPMPSATCLAFPTPVEAG